MKLSELYCGSEENPLYIGCAEYKEYQEFADLMMDEFVEAITELYDNQIEAIQGLMQTNKQLSKCVAYLDDLRNIKNLPENKRVERLAGWLKAEEF